MGINSEISYRINAQDELIFVNEEWSKFALLNGGDELIKEKVLYTSLWNFITDRTTEYIYRQIFQRVRSGIETRFRLRCDSPKARRLLEMTISPVGNGEVQFVARPVWVKERASQRILQKSLPRGQHLIIVCSWCNRMEVGQSIWNEVEEAVEKLEIFQDRVPPALSHGICDDCYKSMSTQHTNDLIRK